jgi:hypothetical protein
MNRSRIALACSLAALLVSTAAVRADVRADEKVLFKFEGMLGRVVSIFGGKAAREGVKTTVAVKGNRKATLSDATGQIVDLSEEKVYDLDIKRKTYKVTTFAEFRQRMEEAQRRAEEEARKAEAAEKTEKKETPPPQQDPNQKQLDVDFDIKETGAKKTINGFDTREVVMTITLREKGKTLEESGGMVLTSDMWIAPRIEAMKEIAEFDLRYAKQLAGPMVVGASPEEMASVIAMYPGTKEALARMRAESVNLDGTPILTSVTLDAVKTAEQMAQEQKQNEQSSSSSGGSGVSGLLGGFAKRAMTKKEPPKSRVTFLTTTNEVLKVSTDVAAGDVAIPAGFKENK